MGLGLPLARTAESLLPPAMMVLSVYGMQIMADCWRFLLEI